MTKPTETERQLARQARLVAVVLVVAMVAWIAAQALGGALGWPARFVFLFDLAALAAFIWAFVVTYQIWQKRRQS